MYTVWQNNVMLGRIDDGGQAPQRSEASISIGGVFEPTDAFTLMHSVWQIEIGLLPGCPVTHEEIPDLIIDGREHASSSSAKDLEPMSQEKKHGLPAHQQFEIRCKGVPLKASTILLHRHVYTDIALEDMNRMRGTSLAHFERWMASASFDVVSPMRPGDARRIAPSW